MLSKVFCHCCTPSADLCTRIQHPDTPGHNGAQAACSPSCGSSTSHLVEATEGEGGFPHGKYGNQRSWWFWGSLLKKFREQKPAASFAAQVWRFDRWHSLRWWLFRATGGFCRNAPWMPCFSRGKKALASLSCHCSWNHGLFAM